MHPARSALILLLVSLITACGSQPDPKPPPAPDTPPACPEGQRLRDDGSGVCELLYPTAPCAAGTMARVGAADCQPTGPGECPAGFERDPSGWGCRDVHPAAECAPGTMPVIGSTTCAPVGWKGCPAGFEKDPSGWGCREILPAQPCTGATAERLGQKACVPVGDCNAAFPPPGATLFVNAALPSGSVDATHFQTIGAALAAASANAVIAVESGTYDEALTVTKPVKLVGRCAEKVTVRGTGGSDPGVAVDGVRGVEVSGVTLTSHRAGASVTVGGSLALRDVVLEGNRLAGAISTDTDAKGTPSLLTLERCAVRGTTLDTGFGNGLNAIESGRLEATDCVISGNAQTNVAVSDMAGASAMVLTRCVLRDPVVSAKGGDGFDVYALDGGVLTLNACVLSGAHLAAMELTGKAVKATVTNTVIRGTVIQPGAGFGLAVSVENEAHLEVHDSLFASNEGGGVQVLGNGSSATLTGLTVNSGLPCKSASSCRGASAEDGGKMTLDDVALVASPGVGLWTSGTGASATASRTLVYDTRFIPDPQEPFAGLGIGATEGAKLSLDTVAVVKARNTALSADTNASVSIKRSMFLDTLWDDVKSGLGVRASQGAQLTLTESVVAGNHEGGLVVIGPDGPLPGDGTRAKATVTRSVVRDQEFDGEGHVGAGVVTTFGGRLDADELTVSGNRLVGVYLVGTRSEAALKRTAVVSTRLGPMSINGMGLVATEGARLSLRDSAVAGNLEFGLMLEEAARVTISGTVVADVPRRANGLYGYGVLVKPDVSLDMSSSELRGAAGVGLVVAGAAVNLRSSIIGDNPVALHAQGGTSVAQPEQLPDLPVKGTLNISSDTLFVRDEVKLGSGAVPLPPSLVLGGSF